MFFLAVAFAGISIFSVGCLSGSKTEDTSHDEHGGGDHDHSEHGDDDHEHSEHGDDDHEHSAHGDGDHGHEGDGHDSDEKRHHENDGDAHDKDKEGHHGEVGDGDGSHSVEFLSTPQLFEHVQNSETFVFPKTEGKNGEIGSKRSHGGK